MAASDGSARWLEPEDHLNISFLRLLLLLLLSLHAPTTYRKVPKIGRQRGAEKHRKRLPSSRQRKNTHVIYPARSFVGQLISMVRGTHQSAKTPSDHDDEDGDESDKSQKVTDARNPPLFKV